MNKKLNIFQEVRELPQWKALAFGCALVERMLPNYQLFCEASSFAEPGGIDNLLNAVWACVISPHTGINIPVQLANLHDMTPDPVNFDNYGVYPALDCAMAITALLNLLAKEDEQGAVVVSKLSQGTVEAFIELTAESQLSPQQIKTHPLMAWEIATQQELLGFLVSAKRQQHTIKALQTMVTAEGVSNIGIARNI